MTKATEDDLSSLHGALARNLTEVIDKGIPLVTKDADGEPVVEKVPAPAAYFAAAITFLKNNNITAGKGNAELDALKLALEKKRGARAPSLTPQALEEAAELFHNRLQ